MKVLIDADVVVYRAGFSSERKRWRCKANGVVYEFPFKISRNKAIKNLIEDGVDISDIRWREEIETDPLSFALQRAKMTIKKILLNTKANSYRGFLSTSGDTTLFRLEIAKTKEYKGNRKDFKKPDHYDGIREYLLKHYNIELVKGIEADDALGIHQNENTMIASIDKDLLQIPGKHYNFVKEEFYDIDEFTGWHNFYKQVLTGDKADNVPGLFKIGDKKAEYILRDCKNKEDMYKTCLRAYELYSEKEDFEEYMQEMCNLLYIQRKENDRFTIPV